MARAETNTKLALDEWARILGVDPLHFNFVEHPSEDPARSAICRRPWLQYAWQGADQIGREDLAFVIAEAEAQIEEMLGYHLMPTWDYDEWRPTTRFYRPEMVAFNLSDVRGFGVPVALNWGYFISGGIEAATLLGSQAVSYTDEDGDNYKETATIGPFNISTSDPGEIEVHIPPTGHAGEYDESNKVRPVRVRLTDNGNGTFACTIRARREQFVKWFHLIDLPPLTAVPGDDDNFFETAVEIWRHYNDPSTQATLLWESPSSTCACNGSGCTNCQYGAQTACLIARGDPKMSMVAYSPGTWQGSSFSSDPLTICRVPDVVRAFYRSGLTYQAKATMAAVRFATAPVAQTMDPHWARAVAYFAASKLDRPVCDCGYTAEQIKLYAADLGYAGGAEELSVYNISPSDLDNPFGTKRGAVMAWKALQSPALGRAVLV